jgi:hypothetical protein
MDVNSLPLFTCRYGLVDAIGKENGTPSRESCDTIGSGAKGP